MMDMQRTLPTTFQRKSMGYFTAILHNETFETENIDLEMGFVIAEPTKTTITLPSQRMMTLRFLPAVETMATAIGIGMPQTIHLYRGALALWVEDNGYEFSGNGREVFIVPPQVGHEHESVIEIQYPIVKREHANLLLP